MEIQVQDRVRGWFGEAIVTDVAYGFTTDAATDLPTGPVDDMVRIMQWNRKGTLAYTYVYRSDIQEIL